MVRLAIRFQSLPYPSHAWCISIRFLRNVDTDRIVRASERDVRTDTRAHSSADIAHTTANSMHCRRAHTRGGRLQRALYEMSLTYPNALN